MRRLLPTPFAPDNVIREIASAGLAVAQSFQKIRVVDLQSCGRAQSDLQLSLVEIT